MELRALREAKGETLENYVFGRPLAFTIIEQALHMPCTGLAQAVDVTCRSIVQTLHLPCTGLAQASHLPSTGLEQALTLPCTGLAEASHRPCTGNLQE